MARKPDYNPPMVASGKSSSRLIWIAGVGFAVLLIAAVARFNRQPPAVKLVPWRTDYSTAMAEAKSANKPVLLDFSATWCGPCQQMKHNTWTDPAVANAVAGDVPISIDGDARPDLMALYHVQAYPTMILLSPTGSPLKELTGSVGPDGFLNWLHSPALP